MSLKIKITNFEGPFDLLLHLIKENKMNIYDIKIYEITNQYISYINKMKSLDLEVTSEFIVMASRLLEIKSRMLLPKMEKEETSEEDLKDQLINRLIEYKKFKSAAEFLKQRELQTGLVFTKKPEIINDIENTDIDLRGLNFIGLYNIYLNIMKNLKDKKNDNIYIPKKLNIDKYKVEDKIKYINNILTAKKNIFFSAIIKDSKEIVEIVVTFLALLELIKLKRVRAFQKDNFGEIFLERLETNEN